jgi:hypothetical protein
MNGGEYQYIWQASDWPDWRFDLAVLAVDIPPMRSHRSGACEATVPGHGKPVAGARLSVGL